MRQILFFVNLVAILTILGCSHHAEVAPTTPTDQPVTNVVGDWENSSCPVTGEAIDKEVSTMYENKKVYFCCERCIAKFSKEPDKYRSALMKPPASKTLFEDTGKTDSQPHQHSGHQH